MEIRGCGKIGTFALAAVLLAFMVLPVQADLISNGGFEGPAISTNPGYLQINSGSAPSGFDWTVTTNSVDVVNHYGGMHALCRRAVFRSGRVRQHRGNLTDI